ncbi:MAG: ABC transporter ATP-binding protein [Ghiorsea sp.]
MFSVTNLSKSYPTPQGELQILQNINFELHKGTFMAIVGESGTGKSTLLQILGTLDQPDSGEMQLNGQNLGSLSEDKLAILRNQEIGFVYQSAHLIPELSALENIMLPLLIQGKSQSYAKNKALELLQKLGLEDRASHIPAHLSGGEAQRVAIGRAIINEPSLILADEPTGNLDESNAYNVFSLMKEVCKAQNIAVIMVTHSKFFADGCDVIYELAHQELNKAPS